MNRTKREIALEHWVRWTLLAGVAISGGLLTVGLPIAFVSHQPRPEGPPPSLGTVIAGALAGDGVAIIDLAMLVLMATPLARVAILAIGWTLEGDCRFAVVALAVLGLLATSLLLGV